MKRLVTLTEQQRAQLVARYKVKNVHLRDRIHCVLLKADGITNRETAALLLTSEHTVNDWLDRYDKGGLETLCDWDVGGSDPHLTKDQSEQLTAELDTHGFQTAKQKCQTSLCLGRDPVLGRHLLRTRDACIVETIGLQSSESSSGKGSSGSRAG